MNRTNIESKKQMVKRLVSMGMNRQKAEKLVQECYK